MGRKMSGNNYRGRDFWRQCDQSGFTVRAGVTRREWNGLIVDTRFWEPRQPQDLVRGVPDDQTVQNPRPLPPDQFSGPIWIALNANAAIGATFIPLGSIAGLSNGDSIGVMMDNGSLFMTTISGNPISTGVNIASPLTYPASSGNLLYDYDG